MANAVNVVLCKTISSEYNYRYVIEEKGRGSNPKIIDTSYREGESV